MRAWFLLFILSIGAGGFFALLVALARTPIVADFIPPQLFYHWLIGHVDSALIIGFLSFLVFIWHRYLGEHRGSYDYILAYLGCFFLFICALFGLGTAVHNNYVPTIVHPFFFAGIGLFGAGYALSALRYTPPAVSDFYSKDIFKNILYISILLSVLFPITFLVSYYKTPQMEEYYLYYERLYWLPGHIHQFINASLLIVGWLLLANLTGFKMPSVFRFVNFLLIPFPVVYFLLQIFVEDSISPFVKNITTIGYAVGIGIPTLSYAFYLLLKVAFRKGFYSTILGLSVLMYCLGALMGYMIVGSDLRIPAHYHGVIASILITLMGLTFYYLKELRFIREVPSFVRIQPYLYGAGMFLFVLGLFWAGVYGAPRKTFGTGYIESLKVYLFMVVMGIGSLLSVVGGVVFVLFVLSSIIRRHEFEEKKRAQQKN